MYLTLCKLKYQVNIHFIVVYCIKDFSNFCRDIERYSLDMIQTNLRIDYKMALELTSGLLILELIHRIFVCVFEVLY